MKFISFPGGKNMCQKLPLMKNFQQNYIYWITSTVSCFRDIVPTSFIKYSFF